MNSDKDFNTIVEKIRTLINLGFTLTPSDIHFLESSFAVSGPDELTELMQDENSDIDIILELIISPDETTQAELESCLQKICFSENDTRIITAVTTNNTLPSEIRFPDSDGRVSIEVPRNIIHRFITKLRVANNPPEILARASDGLAEINRLKSLVKLRNSSIVFNAPANDFFSDFFCYEKSFQIDFLNLLVFAISVIEEIRPDNYCNTSEIMQLFIAKKHFYEKTLDTLAQVEKKLETSAVETMMMQGTRMPPVSKQEVLSKIKMTEELLAVLFGYIDSPVNAPSEVDLGNISDKKEIQKIFRLLS